MRREPDDNESIYSDAGQNPEWVEFGFINEDGVTPSWLYESLVEMIDEDCGAGTRSDEPLTCRAVTSRHLEALSSYGFVLRQRAQQRRHS